MTVRVSVHITYWKGLLMLMCNIHLNLDTKFFPLRNHARVKDRDSGLYQILYENLNMTWLRLVICNNEPTANDLQVMRYYVVICLKSYIL